MIIAITGTPGCGKSTVSKALNKKLKYILVDLNKAIKENKVYSGYDRKRKSYIVDIKKLSKFFKKIKKGNMIIDSHLSHYLPMDIVIVLRCQPKELDRRMKTKKWGKEKRRENFEAELIGLISYEARQCNKKVYDIDTTDGRINRIINDILKVLNGKGNKFARPMDWLR
jgi:adenylate kinase